MDPQFWEDYIISQKSDDDTIRIIEPQFFARLSTDKNGAFYNSALYLRNGISDEILRNVIKYFEEKNKSFTLTNYVGREVSYSQSYLEDRGFVFIGRFARMVSAIDSLSAFRSKYDVREVGGEELMSDPMCHVIFTCFPQFFSKFEDVKQMLIRNEKLQKLRPDRRIINFAAFDGDTPVATASLMIKDDLPDLIELSGASVLPEYRKQGIYKALLSHRAEVAKKMGKTHLYITADLETSAPIVRKLGFQEVEIFEDYHYNLPLDE